MAVMYACHRAHDSVALQQKAVYESITYTKNMITIWRFTLCEETAKQEIFKGGAAKIIRHAT